MSDPMRKHVPQRNKLSMADRLLAVGREAFLARDFNAAVACFEKALEAEPRNAVLHFNLAGAQEMRGEPGEALVALTRALRFRPNWTDAAKRLSSLLLRWRGDVPANIDGAGLLAAFSFDTVDHQALGDAAFAYLRAATPFGKAAIRAGDGEALDAARDLLLQRTEKALTNPLLLTALATSAARHPETERLLAAMRHVIVTEVKAERFADKDLTVFAVALLQQCWKNEHLYPQSDAETGSLSANPLAWDKIAAGEPAAGINLLLRLLVQPVRAVVNGKITASKSASIRPKAIGQALSARLHEDEALQVLASGIPSITPLRGEISERVAQQYEANPYPRWSSLHLADPGVARRGLQRFFEADDLDFMSQPFPVLIAGAGTGQHAVGAAAGYAPEGQVLAIDLSRASLAYGQRMAAQLGVSNIDFARGDIGALDGANDRFTIIEAIGVLHHMADPLEAWRILLRRLKPGGLMWAGLYSATARQNIARIRQRPDYPAPGCADQQARLFRRTLLDEALAGDQEARALTASADFYALSDFRDLLLHEHEVNLTLPEIAAFLEEQKLRFRGFTLPGDVEAAFLEMFPGAEWPGSLDQWHEFEQQHPNTFNGMYKFWCSTPR